MDIFKVLVFNKYEKNFFDKKRFVVTHTHCCL